MSNKPRHNDRDRRRNNNNPDAPTKAELDAIMMYTAQRPPVRQPNR